ncbi:hypothetical protein J3R82DRAFT_90 [Butyriboletus roseoflavus]|nr:hypothetical protein J3R82DRAFT_90 [Butyriboletus roseoflavus]
MPPIPPLPLPLANSKFSLNSAAVAGFFGGKEAISAMATVHLCKGRRWLGWFNSPGSYTVAKRFGRMANSRFWDGLFPGPNDSPAVSFGLDGKKGPEYIAALSGTTMPTGHLAYLTMEQSKELPAERIDGRTTKSINVTYLAMKQVDYQTPVKRLPLKDALLGLIPIVVSVVTCILCALVWDWYCFYMILLGIISSGWASYVIGKGRLVIKSVTNPADGVPPGHGMLMGEGEVVIMFCVSLGVSWGYNSYLSSLEKEKIQTDLLFQTLENPEMLRFRAGTRTTMAVFVCLLLFHGVEAVSPQEDRARRVKILQSCLKNDTVVWRRWSDKVVKQLLNINDRLPYLEEDDEDRALPESDRKLLKQLLKDAADAFSGYFKVRGRLPACSSHPRD